MLEGLAAAIAEGRDPRPELGQAFDLARKLDRPGKAGVFAELDGLLREHPVEKMGSVALMAGAIVEIGGDPMDFPPAVFDRIGEMLATIEPRPEGEDPFELPEAFYEFERAAMAALSRSVELRSTLPQKAHLRSLIRRYSERYGFLGKMLAVLDAEPLVVLHAPTGRGWRFRMGGIADNFQLHLLLMGALAGTGDDRIEGKPPSPLAVAASTDGDPGKGGSVHSSWQLANWFALRPGGVIDKDDYNRSWIWNEGVPADIVPFEGTRVVLIGPTTIQRGWNASRIFSGMRGTLVNEGRLDDASASALVGRILVAASPS